MFGAALGQCSIDMETQEYNCGEPFHGNWIIIGLLINLSAD
jgi:hypothetical protein